MTSNCTCELLASGGGPANSTACADVLKSCGSSSVPVSVGVTLLLLLLAVCGLGGFWFWKRRATSPLALPGFLWRSGSRRRDFSKTLSLRDHAFGPKCKAPGAAPGRRPAARAAGPCDDDYENLEVGPPRAEEAGKGLYENTQQASSAEPVYGNQASPYYNFQGPVSPDTPQDEDIYILPD
ncbi:protein GAPT [Phyllostomus hastatus]|uniref:protein GAPT n=1 Tax=Phyllostomus hastatus TaxID=9423 RepID=UPI001E67F803|nr:protein GAPT [Phyllostomus hastatus]XP_045695917.1 protein GAPT [Phyllostomus hastatus]XP_045695918.1 protein GAPT [Phyllostomus hastatus]XP_045695919.1 protein GAPT [Phyllostomus hastatus]XP_045695920.1 protein GAPT [Phyllostomus hastatus]XP_045695921.1 protein GAPT [Phyllostomus hastatus]XP_045695923.1 protein GAPT [Phyllostomus hastatus]XP_045695924.1 protein GAPT [Phyllostomus hastatus]XP_045695925.1 protein GAPT [Phyllostomus hastatus]